MIILLLSGLGNLLQYPILMAVFDVFGGSFSVVNSFFLIGSIVAFIFPVWLTYQAHRLRNSTDNC